MDGFFYGKERMDNDAGYYRWLNAPIIDEEGIPKRVLHQENIGSLVIPGMRSAEAKL